jgi:exopolysaccharide biosynthesis polyprenyl glycosylphosphotransferase
LKGDLLSNVLVVGGVRSAQEIANWLNQHRAFGLNVTGVWIPDEDTRPDLAIKVPGQLIPVVGNDLDLAEALVLSRADTVIVSDTEHLGHHGLRDLTWQLEDLDIDLMVSPNVADFSGSRIHVRFVAGMPFMHLEQPQYAEAGSWPKLLFDRVFAVVAIIAFSPAIVVAALAVKIDTRGPLLYRQRRVGRDGREFDLLKFRSMHKDADKQLAALVAAQGTGDTPLFKVKDDPRITRVGAFLRRYSIDELPQLFNVLQGEMSLVGPRPQVAEEVKLYDYRAFRRLAVRPGMTGLWQVSGRSDLSWEDAIRLDLYYVENWSLTTDLVILAKTLRAVIGSSGAY